MAVPPPSLPPFSTPYYPPPAPRDPTAVVGRRIVAFIIDALIASAISLALVVALRSNTYSDAPAHACDLLREARGFSGTCVQLGSQVYTWNGDRISHSHRNRHPRPATFRVTGHGRTWSSSSWEGEPAAGAERPPKQR